MTLAPARSPHIPYTASAFRDLCEMVGPPGWREHSACRNADWRLFSPPEDGERQRSYPTRAVEAAAYCRRCPVLEQCRTYADENREVGVWAGAWRNKINPTLHRGSDLPAADDPNYKITPIPLRLPAARKYVRSTAS